MTHSENINELTTALAAAQRVMEGASKDSTNPYFRSKYADLASVWLAIREPLGANGLSVIQMPSAEGSKVTITTLLTHSSGQWISSELTMTAKRQLKDGGGWEELDTPQAIGSTITYARRYALAAVCGVAPEDDDGNAGSGQSGQPQARQQSASSTAPFGKPATPPQPTDLKARIVNNAQEWLKKFIAIGQPQEFHRVLGLHGYDGIEAIPTHEEKAKFLSEDLRMALADCKKRPA